MPVARLAAKLSIEDLTLTITEEIPVRAPISMTFECLLQQLGPLNGHEKGSMPMKLEAWPGGRWYRDLGGENGHFWAHVQAIKRPTLLELCGPLLMSYPVSSNLQYRLSEVPDGTLIKFRHLALGLIEDDHRKKVVSGWSTVHARVKAMAEGESMNSSSLQP